MTDTAALVNLSEKSELAIEVLRWMMNVICYIFGAD